MKKVRHFKLGISGEDIIKLPEDAEILSIKLQKEDFIMLVLGSFDNNSIKQETKKIISCITGQDLPDSITHGSALKYINTVEDTVLSGMCFHFFECKNVGINTNPREEVEAYTG